MGLNMKRKLNRIFFKIVNSDLFYTLIFIGIIALLIMTNAGCVKIMQVKTDTISNLEYIEPQQCKLREINKINYKTTIQDDNIIISNQDMGALLNNFLDYKQAVKENQQCISANEGYYKQIINSILK